MTTKRIYDRETLTVLADGGQPKIVFGSDRERAAGELASMLNGIKPTFEDRLVAAFTEAGARRVSAYDNGAQFIQAAYYDRSGLLR